MKIQTKLTVLISSLLVFFAILLFIRENIEKNTFITLFQAEADEKRMNFDNILKLKSIPLYTFVSDYSFWDEMVRFVANPEKKWAHENIESGLNTFGVNAAWVYNLDSSLVYSVDNIQLNEAQLLPLTKEGVNKLFSESRFCHFFINTRKGLLEVNGATIHPTSDPERKTAPQGYFFVAKLWDKTYIEDISDLVGGKILLTENKTVAFSNTFNPAKGIIAFSRVLTGWDGNNLMYLNISIESSDILVFNRKMHNDLVFFVLSLALFLIINSFFIIRWISRPLSAISSALKVGKPELIDGIKDKKNEFGDIACLIGDFFKQKEELVTGISEHKIIAQTLALKEEQYRLLFNEMFNGFALHEIICDATGKPVDYRYLEVNPAFERLTGLKAEEIIGKTVRQVIPDIESYWIDIYSKVALTREPAYFEHYFQMLGKYQEFIVFSPKKGQFAVIFSDITERKKAEENLQEAVKIRTKFTSMVSHELRTPLTAIKKSIEIVLEGSTGKLNEEQRDFLHTANRNVARLGRLINDILDFQKLDSGNMRFIVSENNLNEVILEISRSMHYVARDKGIDLVIELDAAAPQIEFDRDKITQVLTNLIDNAIKFTEKGSVKVLTTKLENMLQVSIEDTGPGIAPDDIKLLFHSFEQIGKEFKAGGTGLGLVICKEIIEWHHGKIWAESTEGGGSKFIFTLPIDRKTIS